jgi:L-cysteine desulfidase
MVSNNNFACMAELINKGIQPATGCTEPVAIALNAATARKNAKGRITSVVVKMDMCLLKNAIGVGIPGIKDRGVEMCVAIGITGGDCEKGMNVLNEITETAYLAAKELLPKIKVTMDCKMDNLFIETVLKTDIDEVRVVTYGFHDNIIDISHQPVNGINLSTSLLVDKTIRKFTLDDFICFASAVRYSVIEFLNDGVTMNQSIAEAGKNLMFGKCLKSMDAKGYFDESLILNTQNTVASASYARMSGVNLPVMTTTGSGNQGITLFLTVATVADKLGFSNEKKIRAIALAHLINLYAKSYLGTLSALCSCGIAAGLGAAVGIVYLLDGNSRHMLGCMNNILGSVTGMICDGAKEGCANKVALASGLAVMAALMAVEGMCISEADGILAPDMETLFKNVSYIADIGMEKTNQAIVEILLNKRKVG